MAVDIVVNAKMQRPSVCNAAESLVVHRAVAESFLPVVAAALEGVELVGDEATRALVPTAGVADDDDYGAEFLDLKMSVRVVDSLDEAIDHVNRFGTGHSEAIVTTSLEAARRFTTEVDAAAVVVNASTRFVDGEEFGFGAEIGISTQKLHARGPMGLRELTTGQVHRRGHRPDPQLTPPSAGPAADFPVFGHEPHRACRRGPDPVDWAASRPRPVSFLTERSRRPVVCADGLPLRLRRRRALAPQVASTTSPTRASPGSSTWPTGWASPSWSRARPAPARPSWPSRWPR